MAVGSQWVIFTSEGSFVFDTESNMLRPSPPEWNIPGGEVSVDNRGNYRCETADFQKNKKRNTDNQETETYFVVFP